MRRICTPLAALIQRGLVKFSPCLYTGPLGCERCRLHTPARPEHGQPQRGPRASISHGVWRDCRVGRSYGDVAARLFAPGSVAPSDALRQGVPSVPPGMVPAQRESGAAATRARCPRVAPRQPRPRHRRAEPSPPPPAARVGFGLPARGAAQRRPLAGPHPPPHRRSRGTTGGRQLPAGLRSLGTGHKVTRPGGVCRHIVTCRHIVVTNPPLIAPRRLPLTHHPSRNLFMTKGICNMPRGYARIGT
jgi:hypothetical protein